MQHVHIGTTQSGIYGLFTGNTLAWQFSQEFLDDLEHETPDRQFAMIQALCKRLGFVLDDPGP
jgi:hypothetical protein